MASSQLFYHWYRPLHKCSVQIEDPCYYFPNHSQTLSDIRLFSLIIELNITWKEFVACYLLSMFNKLHKQHCHLYFFCSFTSWETVDHFQTSFFKNTFETITRIVLWIAYDTDRFFFSLKHGEWHSLLTKSMDDKFMYGIHFPRQMLEY